MPNGMIESATFARGFREAVARSPDATAVRTLDDSVALSYRELAARVDAMAGGLAGLGLGKGDTIALMLSNRPEFHIADLAATTLGAVPFSIYQTLSPEQIAYVVGDSDAKVAIVEAPFLDRFLEARSNLPDLRHLIVLDAEAEDSACFEEIEASGAGFDGEAAAGKGAGGGKSDDRARRSGDGGDRSGKGGDGQGRRRRRRSRRGGQGGGERANPSGSKD